MGPPPAKRRRKIVASSSEDEGDNPPSLEGRDGRPASPLPKSAPNGGVNDHENAHGLPTRLRSRQKIITKTAKAPAVRWSRPTSPEKKSKAKSTVDRKAAKPTALDTFFNAHRTSHTKHETKKVETSIDEDDFIEDDSFDDELRRLSDPRKGILGGRRHIPAPTQSLVERGGASKLPTGSQVFRKVVNDVQAEEAPGSRKNDMRPWADRYGPASTEELAVHKRKVADVRSWLDAVCHGRSKKVGGSFPTNMERHADESEEAPRTERALRCGQDGYDLYAC